MANRGFTDAPPGDDTKPKDEFSDKPADTTRDDKPGASDPADALKDDQHHDQGGPPTSSAGNTDSTAPPPTPHDAAPASAPAPASGDPARTVTLPDGRVVTAPDDKIATAMRSVLSGTSVPDAFNAVDLPLPRQELRSSIPPIPLISIPDPWRNSSPAHRLWPWETARYGWTGSCSRIGALGSSSDFLGWSKPPTQASAQTAAAAPPVPPPVS